MDDSKKVTFFNVQENPKNYVFCYKSKKSSIQALVNSSLRFSPIGILNDPIENTLQTFFLDTDTRFQKHEIVEYASLLKSLTKRYCDDYIKALCFTLGDDPEPDTLIPQSHMGYMRFSMWSQYADLGKGTCLVLDKDKLDKEFEKLIKDENIFGKHGEITYTESYEHGMAFRFMYDEVKSLKIGDKILKPKIEKYYKEYFFKKRKDWSNEHEYRYVIISDRIQYLNIANSIAGIVFGYNSTDKFVTDVQKLDHLKHISKAVIKLQGYHAYIEGL